MEDNKKYALLLIAQFLKEQGLNETVNCLLRESVLPQNALTNIDSDKIVDDKLIDIVNDRLEFNKFNIKSLLNGLQIDDNRQSIGGSDKCSPDKCSDLLLQDGFRSWSHGKFKFDLVNQIDNSNDKGLIISTKFCVNKDTEHDDHAKKIQLAMTNSRKELVLYDSTLNNIQKKMNLPTIVKLFGNILNTNYQFTCTLNGCIQIYQNIDKLNNFYEFKLHNRLITHIGFVEDVNDKDTNSIILYVVTYGLDQNLKISKLTICAKPSDEKIELSLIDSVKLASHCNSLKVIQIENKPTIFVTRTDFTHVICYQLNSNMNTAAKLENMYNIALNNAQFSTHAFNVLDTLLLLKKYLIIVTSHLPYMRILVVRLPDSSDGENDSRSTKTYYDKIIKNISTEIPNNQFSQPIIKYVNDLNGIVIGNDKGLFALDLVKQESWCLNDKIDNYPMDDPRIKDMDYNDENKTLVITFINKTVKLWELGDL